MLHLALLAALQFAMGVNLWTNQGFTISTFNVVGLEFSTTGAPISESDSSIPPLRTLWIAGDSTKTGLSRFVLVNSMTDLTPCMIGCGSLRLTAPGVLTWMAPPDPPMIDSVIVQ